MSRWNWYSHRFCFAAQYFFALSLSSRIFSIKMQLCHKYPYVHLVCQILIDIPTKLTQLLRGTKKKTTDRRFYRLTFALPAMAISIFENPFSFQGNRYCSSDALAKSSFAPAISQAYSSKLLPRVAFLQHCTMLSMSVQVEMAWNHPSLDSSGRLISVHFVKNACWPWQIEQLEAKCECSMGCSTHICYANEQRTAE